MSEWTEDETRRCDECIARDEAKLGQATAEKAVVEGGSRHTTVEDPDPGDARVVDTPRGQARVKREEEDGQVVVWMRARKLDVTLPADLVRPLD